MSDIDISPSGAIQLWSMDPEYLDEFNEFGDYEKKFVWACLYKRLDVVRQLYQKKRWSLFSAFEIAFAMACENGHLEIVRQLYKWKPTIVNSYEYRYAFRCACENGQLEVVILLFELKHTIVDSDCYEKAFYWACRYGHLEVVRQLYEWKPTAYYEDAFRWACENGHLELVQLLIQLNPMIDLSRFYQYRSLLSSLGFFPSLQKQSIPEGETLVCPICYDTEKRDCLVTPCGHKFCEDCVKKLYQHFTSPTCPKCRQNL